MGPVFAFAYFVGVSTATLNVAWSDATVECAGAEWDDFVDYP
jgi:hypothetical protein